MKTNCLQKLRTIGVMLFLLVFVHVHGQLKYLEDVKGMPEHPRILLLKGEEEKIKNNIQADPVWENMHQSILSECNQILSLPVLERIKTGKRLLSVSREAIRRIFFLSYAYRMTGDEKYFKGAEKEMLAVSRFSDWNPSHFLDVAEMTLGVSIGYDWLYDKLSVDSRETIKKAILTKGLDPSFNSKYAWFLKAPHNWNQVCNAGMSYGALALYEDIPELSKTIIDRAVETIHLPMHDYGPDGAYPEGYGYWDYGTSFNVLFISALEKALKTDYDLSSAPGFINTAYYFQNMIAPSWKCYNYADCGLGGNLSPAMFWFSGKVNDKSLLWNEKHYLSDNRNKGYLQNRILPAVMIWGAGMKTNEVTIPQKKLWVGQGVTPVVMMRTSWDNPNALFVGFKGGTASSNHAHMDAGSFIMEANGVRWAMDFGMQEYTSLEEKGVDLWNRAQNSQRWQVFRYNNFAHNTLTVDNQLQNVKGYAKIDSWSDRTENMNAVSDLSAIYENQLASAKRIVAIVNQKYVEVKDEIKTIDKPSTTIRWTMLTSAEMKITGKKTMELRKDGKKLKLQVDSPGNIRLKTWTTKSTNDFDAANPGTLLVGFETDIPADTDAVIKVSLIP